MNRTRSLLVAVALLLAATVVVCGVTTKPLYEVDGTTDTTTNTVAVLDVSTGFMLSDVALNVTNNQALTITAPVIILNGIGGADNTTNTVTVANVDAALRERVITLIINTTSSNLVTIADSAPLALSAAWVGDNDDNLTLYVVETNKLVETGRVNN